MPPCGGAYGVYNKMFYKEEKNGVAIYRSTLLDAVCHGFSTRLGGVSLGDTASLNLGYCRGDAFDDVNENRRRFAAACGVDKFLDRHVFTTARQIHSARVEYVTAHTADADYAADAFVTDITGVPIAVKIADCVPILLYEGGAGVAAAVHAGWRGTAGGIAAVAVERMCRLGAVRSRIRAAVGPSICGGCFVVGEDFPEQFRDLASRSHHTMMRLGAEDMIRDFIARRDDGRLHCDLQAVNERLLGLAGVGAVDVSGICTAENAGEFWSHRRDGERRGVMGALIML